MASPQCENGYTRIANELLDAIIKTRFPGQEMRIMLAVLRRTYGFSKKMDEISYGQLAQMTDIPRPRVIEHVKSLVSKKGLGSLNNGTRKPPTLWINKDFDQWTPSPKKETSPNHETMPSPNNGTMDSPNHETHKRNNKEIIKKEANSVCFPEWFSEETWKLFMAHRRAIKAAVVQDALSSFIKKFDKLRKQGFESKAVIDFMIEKGWRWFRPEWLKAEEVMLFKRDVKNLCRICKEAPATWMEYCLPCAEKEGLR